MDIIKRARHRVTFHTTDFAAGGRTLAEKLFRRVSAARHLPPPCSSGRKPSVPLCRPFSLLWAKRRPPRCSDRFTNYRPATGTGVRPPSLPGEYRIRRSDGAVLCAGTTDDLLRRMEEHVHSGKLAPGRTFEYRAADGPSVSRTHRGCLRGTGAERFQRG